MIILCNFFGPYSAGVYAQKKCMFSVGFLHDFGHKIRHSFRANLSAKNKVQTLAELVAEVSFAFSLQL